MNLIYFDLLGAVLESGPQNERRMLDRLYRTIRPKLTFAQFVQRWPMLYGEALLGRLPFPELIREMDVMTPKEITPFDLEQEFGNVFASTHPVRAGVLEILERLRDKDRQAGLLCDAVQETAQDILEKEGILEFFEPVVCSSAVGALLPDRKMFEAAAAAAGLEPDGLVFISDDGAAILAAEGFGIRSIRMPTQLIDGKGRLAGLDELKRKLG